LKKFFILPIVVLSLSLLSGCGGQSRDSGVTTVEFWTMQLTPGYTDYVQNLIDEYEKANPEIKIKWIDVPWTSLEPRLLTGLSSRRAPDVVNLSPDLMLKFTQNNQLEPIEDHITLEEKDRYFAKVWESNAYEGVVYGIPWYLATDVLMVNEEIFKAAGIPIDIPIEDYPALYEIGKQIWEKTGKYTFMMPWGEPGRFKGHLNNLGVKLVNDDLTAAFNTPRAAEELRFWKKMLDEKIIPRESFTVEHSKTIEFYASGRGAVLINGPQFLNRVKELNRDIYEVTRSKPAMRTPENKIDLAIQNLVVPKQSKNIEEAVDFALYVTNAENQLAFCKLVTIFPSVIEAANDPYFTSEGEGTPMDEARRVAAAQLEYGARLMMPFPNIQEMDQITATMIQEVCLGDTSPEEALAKAEKKWNKSVEELRASGIIK
jgi:putative chitobiose transport system substrate-binding protein